MIRNLHVVLLLAVSLWAMGVGQARAQGADPETDELLDRGISLRSSGDDAEARDAFDQAFQRSGSAEAQAQRGLASQALGDLVAAHDDLSAALASGHPWVARNRGTLEQSLAVVRRQLALLYVQGPAGTRVRVRGEDRGTLPAGPFALTPGDAEVVLEPPGGARQTRQLALVVGRNEARVDGGAAASAASGGGGLPVGGLALTVVGAALVVVGAVLLAVGASDVSALQGTPDGTRAWDEVAADRDRAYALEGAGVAGLGVGGVVLGIGLGWVATGESSGASARLSVGARF